MGSNNQLLARKIRGANVYCEVLPFTTSLEEIMSKNPKGIILIGGSSSISEENAPKYNPDIFNQGIPVLGVGYGMQLMTVELGGAVEQSKCVESGKVEIALETDNELFSKITTETNCWMDSTFQVSKMPSGFNVLARTRNCAVAAIGNEEKNLYGVQFHPEVMKSQTGIEIIKNFYLIFVGAVQIGQWHHLSMHPLKILGKELGTKRYCVHYPAVLIRLLQQHYYIRL